MQINTIVDFPNYIIIKKRENCAITRKIVEVCAYTFESWG